MSEPTEPVVPLLSPAQQAMAISQAMRQAAIDVPRDLPAGLHWAASVTRDEARVVVTVQAKNAYGYVAWEGRYDGTGRRLQIGGGITF